MIDTMDKHSCELFLEDALEIGRRLVETRAAHLHCLRLYRLRDLRRH